MKSNFLRHFVTVAIFLGLFVVMLGAYTRLTDAGLGCPDWPGCYGRMVLPSEKHQLSAAQTLFPEIKIETQKAWTEMAHRYAAGSLALMIAFIAGYTFFKRRQLSCCFKIIPGLLLGLVVFQALLGMWTVTLKLLPVVVMGHLLGGILIFSLLCYYRWQISEVKSFAFGPGRFWVIAAIFIVLFQIALGGWVSANYAGVACIGFPACNGAWWPAFDFSQGFHLLSPVGANYQGGVLDIQARITIQMVHRIGAIVTLVYLWGLGGWLLFKKIPAMMKKHKNNQNMTYLRWVSMIVILLVSLQFLLGILNVVYVLPLPIAVAHNGVAALLLASVMSLFFLTKSGVDDAP